MVYSFVPDSSNERRSFKGALQSSSRGSRYLQPGHDNGTRLQLPAPFESLSTSSKRPPTWLSSITKNVILLIQKREPTKLQYALTSWNPLQPTMLPFIGPPSPRIAGSLKLDLSEENSDSAPESCRIESTWIPKDQFSKLIAVVYSSSQLFLLGFSEVSKAVYLIPSSLGEGGTLAEDYQDVLDTLKSKKKKIGAKKRLEGIFLTTENSVYYAASYGSPASSYQLSIIKMGLATTGPAWYVNKTEILDWKKFKKFLKIANHGFGARSQATQDDYGYSSAYYRLDSNMLSVCSISDDNTICSSQTIQNTKRRLFSLRSVPRSMFSVVLSSLVEDPTRLVVSLYEHLKDGSLKALKRDWSFYPLLRQNIVESSVTVFQDFWMTLLIYDGVGGVSGRDLNLFLMMINTVPYQCKRGQKKLNVIGDQKGRYTCNEPSTELGECLKTRKFTGSCLECAKGSLRIQSKSLTGYPDFFTCKKVSTACQPPFYFKQAFDSCYNCQKEFRGCLECQQGAKKCLRCSPGFTLDQDSGQCRACASRSDPACTLCSYSKNTKKCLQCKIGFSLFESKCIKNRCSGNCAACLPTRECLQCQPGYSFVSETNKKCEKCSKGFFKQKKKCVKCSSKTSRCAECNPKTGVCSTCSHGFKIDPKDKTCLKDCGPYKYLRTIKKDTRTRSGRVSPARYFEKDCKHCQNHCMTCADITGKCLKCRPGYKPTGDGVSCRKSCNRGEYWSGKKTDSCYSCDLKTTHCLACEDQTGRCLECQNPFRFNPESNKCQKSCPRGQYIAKSSGSNFECRACNLKPESGSRCLDCDPRSGTCFECQEGYYLTETGFCVKHCEVDQYWTGRSSNTCELCGKHISGCLECGLGVGGKLYCFLCEEGFDVEESTSTCQKHKQKKDNIGIFRVKHKNRNSAKRGQNGKTFEGEGQGKQNIKNGRPLINKDSENQAKIEKKNEEEPKNGNEQKKTNSKAGKNAKDTDDFPRLIEVYFNEANSSLIFRYDLPIERLEMVKTNLKGVTANLIINKTNRSLTTDPLNQGPTPETLEMGIKLMDTVIPEATLEVYLRDAKEPQTIQISYYKSKYDSIFKKLANLSKCAKNWLTLISPIFHHPLVPTFIQLNFRMVRLFTKDLPSDVIMLTGDFEGGPFSRLTKSTRVVGAERKRCEISSIWYRAGVGCEINRNIEKAVSAFLLLVMLKIISTAILTTLDAIKARSRVQGTTESLRITKLFKIFVYGLDFWYFVKLGNLVQFEILIGVMMGSKKGFSILTFAVFFLGFLILTQLLFDIKREEPRLMRNCFRAASTSRSQALRSYMFTCYVSTWVSALFIAFLAESFPPGWILITTGANSFTIYQLWKERPYKDGVLFWAELARLAVPSITLILLMIVKSYGVKIKYYIIGIVIMLLYAAGIILHLLGMVKVVFKKLVELRRGTGQDYSDAGGILEETARGEGARDGTRSGGNEGGRIEILGGGAAPVASNLRRIGLEER